MAPFHVCSVCKQPLRKYDIEIYVHRSPGFSFYFFHIGCFKVFSGLHDPIKIKSFFIKSDFNHSSGYTELCVSPDFWNDFFGEL